MRAQALLETRRQAEFAAVTIEGGKATRRVIQRVITRSAREFSLIADVFIVRWLTIVISLFWVEILVAFPGGAYTSTSLCALAIRPRIIPTRRSVP